MMSKMQTYNESDIRNMLGAYLTKPLSVTSGTLSTQQTVSVTSVSQGGVQGEWRIGARGRIIVNDGTNDRVIIGYLG